MVQRVTLSLVGAEFKIADRRWDRVAIAIRLRGNPNLPLCRDQGVAVIPWSPLARGFLAGNRQSGDKDTASLSDTAERNTAQGGATTERTKTDNIAQGNYYRESDFRVVAELSALAAEKSVSNATLAYAWLLHKGVAAPIVGASKLPQLNQAVAVLDMVLSVEALLRLEAAYEPHPVLGHS
jgi:aryl-alcohol dehydrogenase-like predicted oxidoreductase